VKERHEASDIRSMCSWLRVSRSGYYSYLRAMERPVPESETEDRELVRWAYGFRGRAKGARQIKMTLCHEKGINMNLKKVRRIMKDIRLSCPIRKANPLRRMAKAMKTNAVFPNRLNRQFATSRPGRHLLTDISYIYYGANGRCYLSTVKDASTNEILAWTVSESLGIGFVIEMLRQLDGIDWLPQRFVLHSDQGCHYTSTEYRKFLSLREITQSMSRRGNCWDNAPMESFFGHAKDELHLRECLCFSQVREEIGSYMDYYNHSRCQWGRRRMTPAEYRGYLLSQPRLEVMVPCGQKYLHGLAHEGIQQ
jgi:transposase InsO family protein